MATVTLKNMSKTYGTEVNAVRNISLSIKDGEFVCLLGPSGCGKSTTLRAIAGLEKITSGDLFIGDKRVNDLPPRDRDIAMAFENYALYPHMTVAENIAFPLRIRKMDQELIRKKVLEVAELMGIRSLLNENVKDLSGGAQQRTGVARALVRNPQVLLLDEPISHLEEELKARMREDLKKLQQEIGVTTIYVTHDQIEAMVMADRIAIMNFGVLQQFGTAEDVYERPANVFVGGFIGEPPMNFLSCEFNKDSASLSYKGRNLFAPAETLDTLRSKGVSDVILGIRDTQISVSPTEQRGAVKAPVIFIEPRNEEQILTLRLADTDILVSLSNRTRFRQNQDAWMRIDFGKANFFDPKTEANLFHSNETRKD
jgi:multiple sugar transport system ATP-binding protein